MPASSPSAKHQNTLARLNIDSRECDRFLDRVSRMAQYLGDRQLNLVQTYTDEQQWFGLLLCQVS